MIQKIFLKGQISPPLRVYTTLFVLLMLLKLYRHFIYFIAHLKYCAFENLYNGLLNNILLIKYLR